MSKFLILRIYIVNAGDTSKGALQIKECTKMKFKIYKIKLT